MRGRDRHILLICILLSLAACGESTRENIPSTASPPEPAASSPESREKQTRSHVKARVPETETAQPAPELFSRAVGVHVKDAQSTTSTMLFSDNPVPLDRPIALDSETRESKTATAKVSLEGKADPDARNENGETPLMVAARRGREEAVKNLLKTGADPNVKDNNGATALMKAAGKDYLSVALPLLEGGADPHLQDNEGATALLWAARNGAVDVVNVLLNAGADPSVKDQLGETPLAAAVQEYAGKQICSCQCDPSCRVAIAVFLLDGGFTQEPEQWAEAVTSRLRTEGEELSGKDEAERAETSIPDAQREDGFTPLEIGTIAAGAETEKAYASGDDSLSVYERYKKASAPRRGGAKARARRSIQHGRAYRADFTRSRGRIPKFDSGASSDVGNPRRIPIGNRASPNTKTPDGNPVLIEALSMKNFTVADALLERGADPNAKDKTGAPALLIATRNASKRNLRRDKALETIRALLGMGANVNAKGAGGRTALMVAPRGDIATILIEAGARINARDDTGKTAFDYAVSTGAADVVAALLDNGARADSTAYQ